MPQNSFLATMTHKTTGAVMKQRLQVGGGVMTLEQVQAQHQHFHDDYHVVVEESPVDLSAEAAKVARQAGQPGLAKALEEKPKPAVVTTAATVAHA